MNEPNEVIIMDSIPQTGAFQELRFVSIKRLADILSRVINRIHYHRSISDLFSFDKEEA